MTTYLQSWMSKHTFIGTRDHPLYRMSVFEVTNEKLASVNRISERSYFNTSVELRQTTKTLVTMKKELDSIFRRIRSLKSAVASQYPEACSQALEQLHSEATLQDED
ncbi:kxDL motif-containing protein 1-like isoform X2 [Halichondria panicea]|uniref:kxDL motif-containing protein 1-like isoform X2 n=1 Tax=Halichondria panicea TaxID=6063 RepID=UPI00312B67AB